MAFAANEASGSGTPAAAPSGWAFGDAATPQSRWLDLIGGRHYYAIDAAQLNDEFRAIARRLPSMLTE